MFKVKRSKKKKFFTYRRSPGLFRGFLTWLLCRNDVRQSTHCTRLKSLLFCMGSLWRTVDLSWKGRLDVLKGSVSPEVSAPEEGDKVGLPGKGEDCPY